MEQHPQLITHNIAERFLVGWGTPSSAYGGLSDFVVRALHFSSLAQCCNCSQGSLWGLQLQHPGWHPSACCAASTTMHSV